MDDQLLRVLLPTRLLVEIDRQLAAESSSRTRSDFVREAIEQRLLELRFGETSLAEPAATERIAISPEAPTLDEDELGTDDHLLPIASPRSLQETALPPHTGATVAHPQTTGFAVERGPWFLHGRDYPSVWSLWWLTRWTAEAPLELNDYLARITKFARRFAERLDELERSGPLRVTTMFPTSTRGSAGQTFQSAAVGGLVRRRDGTRVAVGPLVLWGVAQIWEHGGEILIAPTQSGLDLLSSLRGLSLALPHDAELARAFLEHLERHAPDDFRALRAVASAVATEPNRQRLISAVAEQDVADSPKLADVYAQAYVARGREWGLFEPKLIAGRYALTGRGSSLLDA
jgi:hypothetical protein